MARLGPKARRLYVPNEDHGLSDAARTCAWTWLECHLFRDGAPPPEPDLSPGPGKRFYHAPSLDRASVWREVPPARLPQTGCLFATETHPDGFCFSSPVRTGTPEAPRGASILWDARRDGLDGWFLRWEQANLGLHDPATAQLTVGEAGVSFSPATADFCAFLRVDGRGLSEMSALCLTLNAPEGSRLRFQAYPVPEIDEEKAAVFDEQICRREGEQSVCFPCPSEMPTSDIRVLQLTVIPPAASLGRVSLKQVKVL